VLIPNLCPEFAKAKFEFLTADRYRFRGTKVQARMTREGVGAPIIAVGSGLDFVEIDSFAQGEKIFHGLTAVIRFDGANCRLAYFDPLDSEEVTIDGETYPLGADFTAPLAFQLEELNPRRRELSKMFRPNRYNDAARLARLQPYSSSRIPVLFIHGLGNSPATWTPVVSFLRGEPAIRRHYQFWFFSHPTGIPYPVSAAALRHQLDQIRERHPDHKKIVVIGHSMGGMISRLLITDSGTTLWDAFYDRPPDEIPFSDETRSAITRTLRFEPRRDISRVIFVSASHRGSYDATNLTGRLGARIIGNPIASDLINREALAYLRAGAHASGRRHIPNSVQVLDPNSRWLNVVDTLPLDPSIPFHSLIGDRGKGGTPDRGRRESSDGVVPFWSSHLEGAESELIVPSGHWSHLHPEGMVEIRRILLKHLD
jgi:pimeloyl-ACP methyl ester carboxylesterase